MDKQYLGHKYQLSEIEHRYGKNVHILSDPVLFSYLSTLCQAETKQPTMNALLKILYEALLHVVVNHEFPRKPARVATRMAAKHPVEGTFTAELIDREQSTVCVNLAGAGSVPSQLCYSTLNYLLDPEAVRHDQGVWESQQEGHGGPVTNAMVLLPEALGASGSAMLQALDLYKSAFGGRVKTGKARKYIALHLIVTPEYLRNVQKRHSDLVVYALRLDRGLSPPDILATRPGEKWEHERGLNEEQAIVPGGGGFGETLNHAYV